MGVQRVTIKDVAHEAGVSVSTASRVLSRAGSTSPTAEENVREAATRLGYRINLHARSLRSLHTQTVGLLIPDVRNPFFAELAHTIEQRALASGYSTLLGNANEQLDQQERYIQNTRSLRVDGMIIAPQGQGQGGLNDLVADGTPMVFVDRVAPGIKLPSVTSDPSNGIAEALRHLHECGHRRIGCIAGPQHTSTGRERLQQVRDAAESLGMELPDGTIHIGDFQERSGAEGAEKLVDAGVDAIFAADSPMTLGALRALQARGVRVGQDVSLVGFDDLPLFSLTDPPLSVVAQDVQKLGEHAFDLLLEVIDGRNPTSVRLPTRLVTRASTRNASGDASLHQNPTSSRQPEVGQP